MKKRNKLGRGDIFGFWGKQEKSGTCGFFGFMFGFFWVLVLVLFLF